MNKIFVEKYGNRKKISYEEVKNLKVEIYEM